MFAFQPLLSPLTNVGPACNKIGVQASTQTSSSSIAEEAGLEVQIEKKIETKKPIADSPVISDVVCSNCEASQCLFETTVQSQCDPSTKSTSRNSVLIKKDDLDDGDSGTGSVDCIIPPNSTMVVVHVEPLEANHS